MKIFVKFLASLAFLGLNIEVKSIIVAIYALFAVKERSIWGTSHNISIKITNLFIDLLGGHSTWNPVGNGVICMVWGDKRSDIFSRRV